MRPAISILIPHLRQSENDKALKICLECLIDNTDVDYELIIEASNEREDIYPLCNKMAERATADYIVFSNSDVFMAPGWARPLLAAASKHTIVAGIMVECGAIPVAQTNICANFGMTPDTFRRREFEEWVKGDIAIPGGRGWYFPSLHPRTMFLARGGFDSSAGGFMIQQSDKQYWDAWERDGEKVIRVESYSYHLQNFSNAAEQAKDIRRNASC